VAVESDDDDSAEIDPFQDALDRAKSIEGLRITDSTRNEVKRMRLQRGKKDKVVMNNSKALCFIIDDD
jgi:hypothetical protein